MSRLAAMSAAWERTPPVAVQLARIAQFFGAVPATRAGTNRGSRPPSSPAQDEWFGSLPAAPVPAYLTPEQYLAQRDEARE